MDKQTVLEIPFSQDELEFFNGIDEYKKNTVKSDEKTNTLSSDDYEFSLTLKVSDFDDDKELKKFIRSCEGIIRKSPEYKIWREYLLNVLGKSKCEISGEMNIETTVEIHHHPMSLYDIVSGCVLKKLEQNKEFTSFEISQEVIELHYKNKIGYIPLITSLHEKLHNGFLKLPIELISGNFKDWMKDYSAYIDEEDMERIVEKISINKDNCGWKQYTLYNK